MARLGSGAFETISGEVVNVTLPIFSATAPVEGHMMAGIDVSGAKEPGEKAAMLQAAKIVLVNQEEQIYNANSAIVLEHTVTAERLRFICIRLYWPACWRLGGISQEDMGGDSDYK